MRGAALTARDFAYSPCPDVARARAWPHRNQHFLPMMRPAAGGAHSYGRAMKVRNSLKSLRGRHRGNQVVRRKGRVYVINKLQKRFKARQG